MHENNIRDFIGRDIVVAVDVSHTHTKTWSLQVFWTQKLWRNKRTHTHTQNIDRRQPGKKRIDTSWVKKHLQ